MRASQLVYVWGVDLVEICAVVRGQSHVMLVWQDWILQLVFKMDDLPTDLHYFDSGAVAHFLRRSIFGNNWSKPKSLPTRFLGQINLLRHSCACLISFAVCLAGQSASSLGVLDAGGCDELPADLPALPPSIPKMPPDDCGQPIPSQLHRGSGGQLNPQSQSILSHLHAAFKDSYSEVGQQLGYPRQMRLVGFLSRISGLDRTVIWRHLEHLEAGEVKFPRNAGGRRPVKVREVAEPLPESLPVEGFPHGGLFHDSSETDDATESDSGGAEDFEPDALCPGLDYELCLGILQSSGKTPGRIRMYSLMIFVQFLLPQYLSEPQRMFARKASDTLATDCAPKLKRERKDLAEAK